MNFDSAFYLFCFLPVLMLLFAAVRGTKGRNVLLLVCGLVFYSFGSLNGLILLLASAVVNYILGIGIMGSRGRKCFTVLGVVLNLAFLGAYKYLDFLLAGVSSLFGSAWESAGLIAPVGISFFTFRSISYLIDTYRDSGAGTKNFPRLLLYISFFPQLMAGPISRFSDFAPQLDKRECGSENMAQGLRRFVIGMGKKLLISAAMGDIADAVFAFGNVDSRLAWLGAIAYTLQIYFDFSGYSDMAIGLGKIFGFDFLETSTIPLFPQQLPNSGAGGICHSAHGSEIMSIFRLAATVFQRADGFSIYLLSGCLRASGTVRRGTLLYGVCSLRCFSCSKSSSLRISLKKQRLSSVSILRLPCLSAL